MIGRCAVLLLLAIVPSACGSLVAPFEGLPRAAPIGVGDPWPRVGVCYNAMFTTPQEVRRVAEEACGPAADPEPVTQDMRLNCPLLTPVRATFSCKSE